MKNSLAIKITIATFFVCLFASGPTFGADARLAEIVNSQFESAKGSLPSSWHVKLLGDKMQFQLTATPVIALTGVNRDTNAPGKADCFIFIAGINQPGRFFFTSSKADSAWRCIANSQLTTLTINSQNVAIISIFQFQAYSGDKFYLPFVLEGKSIEDLQRGTLDACVDRNLENSKIESLTQVVRAVNTCSHR